MTTRGICVLVGLNAPEIKRSFFRIGDIIPPLPPPTPPPLRRRLGLAAVAALVVGDMLGTGIFFTPGELASVAESPWQVYFFWALCGAITLCGALTLAELTTRLPLAGASYHVIREAFGPFPAFLKICPFLRFRIWPWSTTTSRS